MTEKPWLPRPPEGYRWQFLLYDTHYIGLRLVRDTLFGRAFGIGYTGSRTNQGDATQEWFSVQACLLLTRHWKRVLYRETVRRVG